MQDPKGLDIIDAEYKVITPARRRARARPVYCSDRSSWPLRDRIMWQAVYWVLVAPVIIAAILVLRPIYMHFISAWTALY